ncbi:T9SS type A sorting domain-containing protein [Chryseobacterium sp. PTM-20240506]|uniref:T9SS type A sorting domain-containing protein n=1 Tax=unclassified Chryseobacterium TaxID=2593645 RepID=UPI0023596CA3|nr:MULTISPECIES: T9SS type A sorting domain-containing protein [unclassified Chryseobacterium]MDC8106167.1 T9SS type A sorting domain-containing protein [Chryseobacterium sp. B21-037]MDQ1804673.1 T9SS type A sorting domain-containing protein [Chryseobacterium sp. CKR4-1]
MKKYLFSFILVCGIYNAQVFSENFDGNVLPSGWTTNNPDTSFNWDVGSENGFATFPSGAAFFDDDNAGPSSINSNARLVSPVINLSAVQNPKLSFKYANMIYDDDSTLKVEVFNGTSWVQVFTFSGDAGQWDLDFNTFLYVVTTYEQATDIDLTPYANANFQMRFVYDDAGDYSYGVVVDDVAITSGALGTSEVSFSDKMQVYPNPVKDFVHIQSGNLRFDSKITVLDLAGRQVKSFTGLADGYNLSDLPKGSYLILIDNKKEIISKKIIKE